MSGKGVKQSSELLKSAGEFLVSAVRPRESVPGRYVDAARQSSFKAMLLISFIIGIVTLTPMVVARRSELTGLTTVAYLGSFALIGVVFAFHSIPSRIHYLVAVATVLALGTTLLWTTGPLGGGLAWLALAPLLATALIGLSFGLGTLTLATAVAAIAVLSLHGRIAWTDSGFPASLYLTVACADLLATICVGMLMSAAGKSESDTALALSEKTRFGQELLAAGAELRAEQEAHGTARRLAKKQEALFKALVEHSADIVMILDADARIRLCGSSALSILGREAEELRGTDFFSLLTDEYAADRRAMLASSLVSGLPTFTTTFSIAHADGSELPVEMSASNYIHNPDIVGLVISLHDLTREKRAEAKADFFEHFDRLTSLPNKESFLHAVDRTLTIARNRNRVFGVMALGLDRFKRINDMYGTEVGDLVLIDTAKRLKAVFRDDDVVSRYRGDMFFVLFPDIRSQEHIKEVIGKARAAFADPYGLPLGEKLLLSSSMGVALFPNDGSESSELVRNAETAMYMAKESGRDRYRLFDAKLNGQLLERQRIESDLAISIDEDRFEPWFQPKVDANGFIIGAEALVRWRHPGGEIKPPGFFIDIAEKSGSIDRIGSIILRTTCEMAASWRASGLAQIPVSVNLSTRQFGREDLIDRIHRALSASSLDPRLIEFEITESGIMENEREGILKLLRLKDLGVSVSIDDFGTGYSSFSKLKDYPIDTVKIDKSFIDPLPDERKATIIASAIVDLAHTLSFTVVAEGVENAEQLHFLNNIFCDAFQGYLFSKPVPEREFRKMLAADKPLIQKTLP